MLTVDYTKFDVRAGDVLLDLGCGFGRHTYEALVKGAHVVSCDMAMPELEAIRNTAPMLIDDGLFDGQLMHVQVQGDGTRLPFPDNTFDKIIASEVLEHIPDDIAAYDEFFRILKPGGMIAATVPATFPEKICWKLSDEYYAPKAEGGHVRIYTEDEVRSKLEGAAPKIPRSMSMRRIVSGCSEAWLFVANTISATRSIAPGEAPRRASSRSASSALSSSLSPRRTS